MIDAPQPSHPPVEILIAEDSPTQAQRLQFILGQAGYHVTTAANGQRALEAGRLRKPALIISDINMPVMDGFELCASIKADAGLANVPVIMSTTLSDPQHLVRCLECGADYLIAKPYEPDYLLGRVRHVLLSHGVAKVSPPGAGAEIFFEGQRYLITASREQILNLLLSSYAAAEQRNKEVRQAQEQLRGRMKELVDLKAALDEHAIVATTDAHGKLTFVNDKFCAISKYSREELIGQDHRVISGAHNPDGVIRDLWTSVAGGRVWKGEIKSRAKDGTVYWVATTMVPFVNAGGESFQYIVIGADITERKYAEEQLVKAREVADSANRAKSVFLANMSHEIRTPMNAILGFSQLMLRDPDLTPRQCQYLGTINRSGEYLLALINDILEMSKIEAGRTVLNVSTFDLSALLKDLEMMFRIRTDEKKLSFSVEMIGEVPRYIVADVNKLRQVFINVLGNAVKFTEQGGIRLQARAEGRGAAGASLRIAIRDTGPGISPEDQGRLFRHFEQTKTGQQAGTGTGLGLAISQEFVRLMGGTITLSSQVGKGSTFVVALPLNEGEAHAVQARDKPRRVLRLRPGQPTCRVLIADDMEDNRQLLSQLLAPLGFEVQLAANGQEAVEAFENWQPHLILMDYRMPVMDGREAIRRIRAMGGGKDTRIIAVTASAMDENRQDLIAVGADDFVGKPFREGELLQKIHAQVGREYEYAEDSATPITEEAVELTHESLAGWPAELIDPMREAVITADLDRLLEKIQAVEARDPRVAQGLRRLAEGFQYQKLLDLFDAEAAVGSGEA